MALSPSPMGEGGPQAHGLWTVLGHVTITRGTMLGTNPTSAGGWGWEGSTRRCPRPQGCLHVPNRPIVDLMGTTETPSEPSELELDDVVITNPHIEAVLENEDWVEDTS